MAVSLFDNGLEMLLHARKVFFLFDFDGTLVPIKKDPDLCFLPEKTRNLIKRLTNNRSLRVGIISGRGLEDLKKRVLIDGVYYAGSHGLEICGPAFKFVHEKVQDSLPQLMKLYEMISERVGAEKGILMEKKPYSFTVHLRRVEKRKRREIEKTVLSEFLKAKVPSLKIQKGKLVLEIMPDVGWDKSKAVLKILKEEGSEFVPVFFGDDITDENVFEAFRDKGVMVKVGRTKNTRARYYVENEGEVVRFLELFLEKRHG